jgi:hypothetical protein
LAGRVFFMKIGDLVRLSAYGKQRKRADWIDREDIGIIIEIATYRAFPSDYKVQWSRSDKLTMRTWIHERTNHRKDLKYVK